MAIGGTALLTAAAEPVRPATVAYVAAEETAALEAMLADWRETAPAVESEEFQALLLAVEALHAEKDLAVQTSAERMEHLSRIESLVEKHRRSQAESSIAEHAEDLASLLEPVEGLSATAASLRRGDFRAAAETLAAQARTGELPPAATAESFRKAAEALADRATQNMDPDLAEGLRQLAEAGEQQDPAQWQEGAASLGACLNREGGRQLAARLMRAQLDQLKDQKLALAGMARDPERSASSLAALMAGQSPDPGGLQAGSGDGDDPYGEATESGLAANETLQLTGLPGEGESTVETVRSSQAAGEVTRAAGEVRFAEYQALSEQAVRDESLPLVHRETIRRYFEQIRPKQVSD